MPKAETNRSVITPLVPQKFHVYLHAQENWHNSFHAIDRIPSLFIIRNVNSDTLVISFSIKLYWLDSQNEYCIQSRDRKLHFCSSFKWENEVLLHCDSIVYIGVVDPSCSRSSWVILFFLQSSLSEHKQIVGCGRRDDPCTTTYDCCNGFRCKRIDDNTGKCVKIVVAEL